MVEIEKKIIITISGEDVQTLKNICELTRIQIARKREHPELIGLTTEEYTKIEDFINEIFDI